MTRQALTEGACSVGVLILAGGEASRMGGGKPLRLLRGQTLLERAAALAGGWSDRVAIAARSVEQVGELKFPVLIDPPDIEGPLAGLASAPQLDRPFVLTIPCDMPFLPGDLLERLSSGLGGRAAALAASGGRVHPVCGLWRIEAFSYLPRYCQSGRRSMIGFAESVGYRAVEWSDEVFANVNTPAELRAADKRLG